MENIQIIQNINKDLSIELSEKLNATQFHKELSDYINLLIKTNFERMVSLLYRIDVSEIKLKQLLANNPKNDAGDIIAMLIIERQIQKINSKINFNKNNFIIDENEKW